MSKRVLRRAREEFAFEEITLVPCMIFDPSVELVSVTEAAELLGVSCAAVGGLLDRRSLRTVRRSGSRRRWLMREEVVALAERRSRQGAGQSR